jgi:hypothetical protein
MERFGNVKTCQNSKSENEAEEEREKEGAVFFFLLEAKFCFSTLLH